jgi:predicted lipoprotein with Yx(FWY)xxD motif
MNPDGGQRMRRSRTLVTLSVAALAAMVTLAACGSDSDDSSSSTSTTAAAAGSGGSAKAVVFTTDNATLGKIVVDGQDRTVYTLTDSAGKALPCEGSCLAAWPPVLIDSGSATGNGVKDVATTTIPEGKQVTVNGLPVYTFAGDGAGDATGEGLASFGGVWHVVKVSGDAGRTGSTDSTSPTTSDYGY